MRNKRGKDIVRPERNGYVAFKLWNRVTLNKFLGLFIIYHFFIGINLYW